MCLTKLTTDKPLTAQQNIFCWKKLEGNRNSTHYEYRYSIGKLQCTSQELVLCISSEEEYVVRRGYHSWKRKSGKFIDSNMLKQYNSTRRANYLFVIPKGSTYFEGYENDYKPGYVSSNIICLGHWLSPMTWLRAFKYQLQNDNNGNTETK